MATLVHIFKFKRCNAGFPKAVEEDGSLNDSRILTQFWPQIWVHDYLWPSVRDYLDDEGVWLGNKHLHLNDLKPYHVIATEPFYQSLLNIAKRQPSKYGVHVRHHAEFCLSEWLWNGIRVDNFMMA